MPKQSNKPAAGLLTSKERKALKAKFRLDESALIAQPAKPAKPPAPRAAAVMPMAVPAMPEERKYFPDFPVGRFEGEPTLIWVEPDRFLHQPNQAAPFRFVRSNGEIIAPGRMFTDGGSIPRALWSLKDLSPWTYGPAFLIHDWLFDLHHCGKDTRSFEAVRDIMLEGIRSLMESGVCEMNRLAFDLIYAGIDSFVARQVWNRPGCHLP